MNVTVFFSAKGGQGCSTLATAYAAMQPHTVTLWDATGSDDCAKIAGCPPDPDHAARWVAAGCLLRSTTEYDRTIDHHPDHVTDELVIDIGNANRQDIADRYPQARWILVTRACYFAVNHALLHWRKPDLTALIYEEGRSLRDIDLELTLGAPVHKVAGGMDIARMNDAGLLIQGVCTNRTAGRILGRSLKGLAA